jgi:hypothetical protein
MCRKAHAAPFASFTSCATENFEWLSGEEQRGGFTFAPGVVRRFCMQCGSCTPDDASVGQRVVIPAGGLDTDPGLRNGRHRHTDLKACWHSIGDRLERVDTPGAEGGMHGVVPTRLQTRHFAPTPGMLHGSCLCGTVAYVITQPFSVIHNCHCSRCRKARAAAHTTNGFVPLEAFAFTRGEEALCEYKVPAALSFGQAFCTVCGGGMPRRNIKSRAVSVPLGSLDEDTSQTPDDHIFVGSKAPWYEIADELPQFALRPD